MTKKPQDRVEVYYLTRSFAQMGGWPGDAHSYAQSEVRELGGGKQFYRFRNDSWVFDLNGENVALWNDLPNRLDRLRSRLFKYLSDPARSEADKVARRLGEERFFSKQDYDSAVRVLEKVVTTSGFCVDGQQRFRDFMGDLMEKPDTHPHKMNVVIAFTSASSVPNTAAILNLVNDRLEGQMTCRFEMPKE